MIAQPGKGGGSMLTINRIREHWKSVEVRNLRRQIHEMQNQIERLQADLDRARSDEPQRTAVTSPPRS